MLVAHVFLPLAAPGFGGCQQLQTKCSEQTALTLPVGLLPAFFVCLASCFC